MTVTPYLTQWKRCPLPLCAILFVSLLVADRLYIAGVWPSLILATAGWILFLTRLSFDKGSIGILATGMAACWWWLLHIDFRFCTADLPHHIAYMVYISQHFTLPMPHEGWEFFHPPLYYIITGLIHAVCTALKSDPIIIIRLFSLLCFLTFLIYATLTLKLAALPPYLYYFCLTLTVLWPSGITIASRINSDLLVYVFCMASFYHLLYWHQSAAPQELKKSLIHLGLAIMTRSNAIVMIITMAATLACNLFTRRTPVTALWHRRFLPHVLFVMLALSINGGRNIYERLAEQIHNPFIVGNAEGIMNNPSLLVSNDPTNFLTFDYTRYLTPPFVTIQRDDTGRQNFWTVFFKSTLWCACVFKNTLFAKVANICLLVTMAYMLVPVFFYSKQRFTERIPHLILVSICITALLLNRYFIPATSSGEWRYFYFATISLATLLGHHLNEMKQQHKIIWYELGIIAAAVLILSGDVVYWTESISP